MTTGLFYHTLPGIDENNDQFRIAGSGNHVPGILDMTGSISYDEFSFGCGEITIRNIDGDALFSFRPQTIGQQCQIHSSGKIAFGRLYFKLFQLIHQNVLTVV